MKCSIETWNNKSNQLEITGTKQTNKLRVDITIPPPPRRNDSSFSNREGREPQRGRVIVKKLVGSISWHRWSRSINQAKINQGNKDGASGRGKEWGEGRRRRKEGRRKVRRGYPLVGSAARPVQLTIKGESKSPDLRGWGERGRRTGEEGGDKSTNQSRWWSPPSYSSLLKSTFAIPFTAYLGLFQTVTRIFPSFQNNHPQKSFARLGWLGTAAKSTAYLRILCEERCRTEKVNERNSPLFILHSSVYVIRFKFFLRNMFKFF